MNPSDYICPQCGNEVSSDDDPRHTCPRTVEKKAGQKVQGKHQHDPEISGVLTGQVPVSQHARETLEADETWVPTAEFEDSSDD